MGRSRGGLTTKIHALVDAEGRPVRVLLTPGQAADAPPAPGLIGELAPGSIVIGDRAYDTNAIRDHATRCGARANIPPRVIRKETFAFSSFVYRYRNLVERSFNRLKHFAASPHATTADPTTSWPQSLSPRSAIWLKPI